MDAEEVINELMEDLQLDSSTGAEGGFSFMSYFLRRDLHYILPESVDVALRCLFCSLSLIRHEL